MILRKEDTCMGLRRKMIVFVSDDRNNVGIGAVVMKVVCEGTPAHLVKLVTEQQDSAAAKADLEQSAHNRRYGYYLTADIRQSLCSGFDQGSIG